MQNQFKENSRNCVLEESGYSILFIYSNNLFSCIDIENKARKHQAAKFRLLYDGWEN
jgi:hypothetical protein